MGRRRSPTPGAHAVESAQATDAPVESAAPRTIAPEAAEEAAPAEIASDALIALAELEATSAAERLPSADDAAEAGGDGAQATDIAAASEPGASETTAITETAENNITEVNGHDPEGEVEMVDRSAAPTRWKRCRSDAARAPPVQDPGGHQAPAGDAGAGGQGRARHQGRGAHHLPLARRPLLGADAEYRARRRHQPQDHQRRRSPATEGDRRRSSKCRKAWA